MLGEWSPTSHPLGLKRGVPPIGGSRDVPGDNIGYLEIQNKKKNPFLFIGEDGIESVDLVLSLSRLGGWSLAIKIGEIGPSSGRVYKA